MNNSKKTAIVIFAACVLVFAFTSCQRGASNTGGGGTRFTFSGYPMNARDQTITWFVGEGYALNAAFSSGDQSPFHSGLRDMLGVNIDWIFPIAGTNQSQAINLIFASGDLPDVMFGGGLMGEAARYIEEEAFHDLTPYIQQWSPAYWAWIHTDPAYVSCNENR